MIKKRATFEISFLPPFLQVNCLLAFVAKENSNISSFKRPTQLDPKKVFVEK